MVSVLVLRSVSAWALPRPSAMASAKLANSTVNQSHSVIWNVKPRPWRAGGEILEELEGGHRGAHFHHEHHRILHHQPRVQLDERVADGALDDGRIEQRARADSLLGNQQRLGDVGESKGGGSITGIILAPESRHHQRKQFAVMHQKVLHDRAQRKRREKGQRADDQHDAHQQADKQTRRAWGRFRPRPAPFSFAPGCRRRPAAESSSGSGR